MALKCAGSFPTTSHARELGMTGQADEGSRYVCSCVVSLSKSMVVCSYLIISFLFYLMPLIAMQFHTFYATLYL